MSIAELALAWVLQNDNVASAIIGASRPGRVGNNVKAVGVRLDPELKRAPYGLGSRADDVRHSPRRPERFAASRERVARRAVVVAVAIVGSAGAALRLGVLQRLRLAREVRAVLIARKTADAAG